MKKQNGLKVLVVAGALFFAPLSIFAAPASSATAADDVKTSLSVLLETKSCRGCNLKGVNLNRADLEGADLEGADLSGAKLHLANLAGANLKNSNLQGAVFGGADLAGADLRGAKMEASTLDGAYVAGALLTDDAENKAETTAQVSAPTVQSEGAIEEQHDGKKEFDEEQAVVEEPANSNVMQPESVAVGHKTEKNDATETTKLQSESTQTVTSEKTEAGGGSVDVVAEKSEHASVSAQTTTVEEAPEMEKSEDAVASIAAPSPAMEDMSEEATAEAGVHAQDETKEPTADPRELAREKLLDTGKCYGCDLSGLDLSGGSLKKSDLEKANLSSCNLSDANLSQSNLKGAVIRNANLRNADLRDADLYKADLSGSDLTGARLEGAIFEDTQLTGVIGMDDD